jgi:23S rRNA-/tRNA-specific pseudouridylate synthase
MYNNDSYGVCAFGTRRRFFSYFLFYLTMSYNYNNKIPNDITIIVVQGLNNERLDVLLSKSELKIPRSQAARLIEAGRVLINDSAPSKNYKVI